MDFDDWWEMRGAGTYDDARYTWGEAQQAEREKYAELLEYLQHDSWRCGYNNECHCGLNALLEKHQLPPVPLPGKT